MAGPGTKTPANWLGNKRPVYPAGENFGWRDITGPIEIRGVAATDPSWARIGSSPFWAYKFATDDIVWMCFHVPHDIVPTRPVHFHAHWITDGTSTNNVTWQWTYMYAKGFNQANFSVTGTTVTATQAAAGTAYRHMVTETTGQTIAGLTEPDGLIYVQLSRIANTTSPQADNADGVFLLTADVHYQSTDECTAGKSPDFYQF